MVSHEINGSNSETPGGSDVPVQVSRQEIGKGGNTPLRDLARRRWRLWGLGAIAALIPGLPDIVVAIWKGTLTANPVLSAVASIMLISTVNLVDADLTMRGSASDKRLTIFGNFFFAFFSLLFAATFTMAAWSPDSAVWSYSVLALNNIHIGIYGISGIAIAIIGEVWLAVRLRGL